jgi:hypothetical protein
MGVTRRDIQFYSQFCPANNPPVLRTWNNDGTPTSPQPNYSYSVCAGQQLCFMISAWDNTAGTDSTDITWNNPTNLVSNGATFIKCYNPVNRSSLGPKFDSVRFCWTPPASMASNLPYYFIVTAKDRACPVPARVTRSFSILVRRIPVAIINKTNKNCGYYDFTYTLQNSVPLNNSYTKFLVETSPNSNSYQTYNASSVTNHRFNLGGWYRIRLNLTTSPPPLPNGCPNDNIIDSVFINNPVDVTTRDSFNCFGTPVSVRVGGRYGTPYGLSYRYTFYSGTLNSTTVIRAFGIDSNCTINPPTPGVNSSYKVVIQDLNGCKDSAAFNLFTRNLPLKELPPTVRFCYSDRDTLNAGNSANSVSFWRWSKTPSTLDFTDTTSQKILPRDSGQYIVRKVDNFGCVRFDTSMVYINAQVPVNAGQNKTICFNDPPINIVALGTSAAIDSFQWRQVPIVDPTIVLSRSNTLTVSPPTNTTYQVTGFITYGGVTCSYVDSMDVTVKDLPAINRPSNISI